MMADVDTAVMWKKWMGALQQQLFPNGLGKNTTFSAGSTANYVNINDSNPGVTNYSIYNIGNVVPDNSPDYAPATSGLIQSFGIFLDYIDLGGDTNPNLESQINIATSTFNDSSRAYQDNQIKAFTDYAAFKSASEGAGREPVAYDTWVVNSYPALASSRSQMVGDQSTLDGLNIQRYGEGYTQIQAARAAIGFGDGGAQSMQAQNPNNMKIATGSLPPPGSKQVLIGDLPASATSSLVDSFAPSYNLDSSYNAKYAEWQTASLQGAIGSTVELTASSSDSSYDNSGWAASASASWRGWFRSASGSALASGQTVDIDTSSTDFNMKVDFVGLAEFSIGPGLWWQGSLVADFKNSLKPGAPDFFSDAGSLSRRASKIVLGFQPTVTIKMSAADYSRLKTSWQAEATVSGSFGPFSFGASSSAYANSDDIHYDDASASITVGPIKSTMPVLLGVISSKL